MQFYEMIQRLHGDDYPTKGEKNMMTMKRFNPPRENAAEGKKPYFCFPATKKKKKSRNFSSLR
jgi:hypothetical protein